MISSFCVTGSASTPPTVKAGITGVAISIGNVALVLNWVEAVAMAEAIQALARKTGNGSLEIPESLSTPSASQG